ncbi:MAG: cytochrome P450 [Steroidobacteraceae bacterium]
MTRWAAQAARGELVNLTDDMSELTLEIVLGSIFGKDLVTLTQQPGGNPFAIVTKETARDLKFAYQFRSLAKLVAGLMARRRAEPAEHFDYLSMLMNARDKESGDPMTERALIDEVMTLVVAGHETTASGLNWAWYLLAKHPDVDARMHAEIEATPELVAPGLGQMEQLSVHSECRQRSAAPVPARVAPVPAQHRSGRTLRVRDSGGHRCAAQAPTCCTGIRSTGRSRTLFGRNASTPSTKVSDRALRIFPLPPVPATASGNPWPFTRCSCTCTRSPDTTGLPWPRMSH